MRRKIYKIVQKHKTQNRKQNIQNNKKHTKENKHKAPNIWFALLHDHSLNVN